MPSLDQQQGLAITEAVARLQLSPSTLTTPLPPPTVQVSCSVDVALSVLTNVSLLSNIGAFQEDPVAFVAKYKMKMLGRKQVNKEDTTQGSLVHVAIKRGDLHALKMIHTARLLNSTDRERPELSFHVAMHDAVSEGRIEIIKWLHTRSLQHPMENQCRPHAPTLLKILRENRMDVVRCLFDQHDDHNDHRFMVLMTDALHRPLEDVEGLRRARARGPAGNRFGWVLSLFQLFVQQRPALHNTLLTLAARAGSVPAASYMLTPRSGVDTTAMVMLPSILVAARGGHRDLVEMLCGAKCANEVIDVAVLREQLSSVGDATALQLVLSVLAAQDPTVQKQLDAERNAASALFGFEPSASSGPPTKRKTAGRSKVGRR